MRRKSIFLAILISISAIALLGFQAWWKQESKKILNEMDDTVICDTCSFLKKDLADQVKHKNQENNQSD